MQIRESQIEDVLAGAPALVKGILRLEEEPRLLVRQMVIPSGRLDLLYTYQTVLLLVELKVVPFQQRFVTQVLAYRDDLLTFQKRGRLLYGEIAPYLLCPSVSATGQIFATEGGVNIIEYDPEEVLKFFYQHFAPVAAFAEKKPIDLGIWNLHLLHNLLYLLEGTESVSQLRQLVAGSPKTLYNKIRFATELRLVDWVPNGDVIMLTPFGREYVRSRDSSLPARLSDVQIELLRGFIIRNPYESPVVLGIASVVEAVFVMSKKQSENY